MMSSLFSLAFLASIYGVHGQLTIATASLQTMTGIGASGAWWPSQLYSFPDESKQNLSALLFSSDWLGLQSYRYNVGGGGVGVTTPARAPTTFYVSQGVYNWSADPAGIYFLQEAQSYDLPYITFFVNSAPAAFTSNGQSCGGILLSEYYSAYSTYLADVITYWKGQGISIGYVSPMNEPDNTLLGDIVGTSCTQEDMQVDFYDRADVVETLRSTLNDNGLSDVGIMTDENNRYEFFVAETPFWLPEAASSLAVVAHHQYSFPSNSDCVEMGQQARTLSGQKPPWFTEICCFVASDTSDPFGGLTYAGGYDPSITSGLQLAQLLWQAFVETQDAHFDWWTAASPFIPCSPLTDSGCETVVDLSAGENDGLVYYDLTEYSDGTLNYEFYLVKRFWVLKHFTFYIPPNAVNHLVSGAPTNVLAMSFALPSTSNIGTWSAILINLNDATETVTVSPGGTLTLETAYRTSDTEDWVDVSDSAVAGSGSATFTVTLEALSVTSFSWSA